MSGEARLIVRFMSYGNRYACVFMGLTPKSIFGTWPDKRCSTGHYYNTRNTAHAAILARGWPVSIKIRDNAVIRQEI